MDSLDSVWDDNAARDDYEHDTDWRTTAESPHGALQPNTHRPHNQDEEDEYWLAFYAQENDTPFVAKPSHDFGFVPIVKILSVTENSTVALAKIVTEASTAGSSDDDRPLILTDSHDDIALKETTENGAASGGMDIDVIENHIVEGASNGIVDASGTESNRCLLLPVNGTRLERAGRHQKQIMGDGYIAELPRGRARTEASFGPKAAPAGTIGRADSTLREHESDMRDPVKWFEVGDRPAGRAQSERQGSLTQPFGQLRPLWAHLVGKSDVVDQWEDLAE